MQPKINTQEIPISNLWMNGENLFPKLRFTVDNTVGSLYKLRLLIFQT